MATTAEHYYTNVVLVFEYTDIDGKTKFKRATLSNVRSTLTPAEIAQVAQSFGDISKYNLVRIERVQVDEIITL